ncbi:MAG: diacylglycerol kinase family protein [Caldilineaceae bacterium]
MGATLKSAQALAQMQVKYARRLKKVERAQTKLAKQRQKLAALETDLASLARQSADAASPANDQSGSDLAQLKRTYVIVNPKAKTLADGSLRLETLVEELRKVGFLAEIGLKASGKVARRMAKAAVKRGDPLLIVAAGDGTIEDIAPELIGSNTTLGILPLGTMNNLARALGIPLDLPSACQLLAMGTTRYLDIGRVLTTKPAHKSYFLEMAGLGLSALAAPLGQDFEKGRWATLLSTLNKFLAFKATRFTITCDDGAVLQTETNLVTLANSPLFGDHLLAAPTAKMDDGLLDLATYDGMSKLELENYFLSIAGAKRVDEPRVRFQQVAKVQITTEEALPANADLDVFAEQPTWEFTVIPRALKVIVGNGFALTLPVTAAPPPPPLAAPPPIPTTTEAEQ